MSEDRIVYSSDGSGKNLVDKNAKNEVYEDVLPESVCLKLRIEKKGRGGKSVTVIYDLPHNPPYFKEVLKKLKSFCGCGGSLKEDTMEIQGDKREKVKQCLTKLGFAVKGH
ncbi:MAG: translation initiation factor [Bacteriovoracaceae bacterium]|nr:translation initiation factor [Bacteriovoracaceae bacterium]